jgi:hypothetical protein
MKKQILFVGVAVLAMLVTPSCLKDDWDFNDTKPVILLGDVNTGFELKTGQVTDLELGIPTIFSAKNAADTWTWKFGDGSTMTGRVVIKTYNTVGQKTLWLVTTNGTIKDSTSTIINVVETTIGDDGSVSLLSSSQQTDGKWQYVVKASLRKVSTTSGSVWTNGEHTGWSQTPVDTITGFARIPVTTFNDTLEIHYGRGATWNTAKGSKYAYDKDPGTGETWVLSILFKDGQIYTRDGALLLTPGQGDDFIRFSILADTLTIYTNSTQAIPPLNSPYLELFRDNTWSTYNCTWYGGSGWSQAKFVISNLPKLNLVNYGGNVFDKKVVNAENSQFFSEKYQALAFQILVSGKAYDPDAIDFGNYEIVPLE